jgi:hypothetical protein
MSLPRNQSHQAHDPTTLTHSQGLGIIISHQTRPATKLLRIPSTSHKPLQWTILLHRAARKVDFVAAVAFAAEFESAEKKEVSKNKNKPLSRKRTFVAGITPLTPNNASRSPNKT